MLQSSLRTSSKRLFRGSYSHTRSLHNGNAPAFAKYSPKSSLQARLSERSLQASALQCMQRRSYAVAAEETNKGVVSSSLGLTCSSSYLSSELIKNVRTQMIPSSKAMPQITWMKCTCNGKETLRVYIFRGRSTSETWRMGICRCRKPFNPRQLLSPLLPEASLR